MSVSNEEKRATFIKALEANGYGFEIDGAGVAVTHTGYVFLPSLTALPKGVAFKNGGNVSLNGLTSLPKGVTFKNDGGVYLDGLTSLPKGVTFKNSGGVSLGDLTSLPKGVAFKNSGYVDLPNLTSLPKGVAFENGGYVDLPNLTALPKGVTFENGGGVFLRRIEGEHEYMCATRTFANIDGYTMLLGHAKQRHGYTVTPARFFAGGPIDGMQKCYVAQSDGLSAHGRTIKDAIEDLQFKIADNADKAALASEIISAGRVTLAQFRGITGACREGISQHLSAQGIDLDDISDMSLSDALKAMDGTSYGDAFKDMVTS